MRFPLPRVRGGSRPAGQAQLTTVAYAGCLLHQKGKGFVLQLRDTDSKVSSPGSLSTFGGRLKTGESYREGLLRELQEELSLEEGDLTLSYLGYSGHFDGLKQHFVHGAYYLGILDETIDVRSLVSREGQVFLLGDSEADDLPIGPVTRSMIATATEQLDRSKPPGSLTDSDALHAIEICLAHASYEANVYWQRNAIYLGLNSLMLGALVALSPSLNPGVITLVGILGVVLSWPWYHVNTYSKYLAERWRTDARAIAADSSSLPTYLRTLVGDPRIPRPKGPVPSVTMNNVARLCRYSWVMVTAVGLAWTIAEIVA